MSAQYTISLRILGFAEIPFRSLYISISFFIAFNWD